MAKPPLPFSTLKRRLHRRLAAMGLKVKGGFCGIWHDRGRLKVFVHCISQCMGERLIQLPFWVVVDRRLCSFV